MTDEVVATMVVNAALKVHRTLGPGLLESVYQQCLAHELTLRGLKVSCEVTLPVTYEGLLIDAGYRIDMLIEDCLIIENKSVVALLPVHDAQILTYMKLRPAGWAFSLTGMSNSSKKVFAEKFSDRFSPQRHERNAKNTKQDLTKNLCVLRESFVSLW